jgi:hypothetical protein
MRGSEWLAAQIVRRAAEEAAKDGGKDAARDGEAGIFRTWLSRFRFPGVTTDVATDVPPPVTDGAGENAGEKFDKTWNTYWDTVANELKPADGEPGGSSPDPE